MKHDFPDKIIFLDVDGVINIPKNKYAYFDDQCMCNLQNIIDNTGAKIVVSSSWRDSDNERMKALFLENRFTEKLWNEIIDITDRGFSYVVKGSKLPIVRGNEIKLWVDTHLTYPWHANTDCNGFYEIKDSGGQFKMMDSNKVGKDFCYVILDDDSDMLYEQKDYFIKTDHILGLTKEDSEKAIKILNYKTNIQ